MLDVLYCWTDGTHSSVVSETLKGTKFTLKAAKSEDVCAGCGLQIPMEAQVIQLESGGSYETFIGFSNRVET